MNTSKLKLLPLAALVLASGVTRADDWLTWRSTYTHDPLTGRRVEQYAPAIEPIAPDQGNLVRSGYRHYRSTIQAGQSADNMHVVHEWGRPVQPYDAWRFPFRPYSVPYDAWGPQTPNVLGNFGFGASYPVPPYGAPAAGAPFNGGPATYGGAQVPGPQGTRPYHSSPPAFPLVPPYQPAPWFDGAYPSPPALDKRSDEQFFYRPPNESAP